MRTYVACHCHTKWPPSQCRARPLPTLSVSLSLPFTLCMFPSARVRPVPVEAGGAGSEPAGRNSKKMNFIVVDTTTVSHFYPFD